MWIYVPKAHSTSSPSAPEDMVSIGASSWHFQALERSLWWREEPSPAQDWYRRWKKVFWLRRLCGAMPEPFVADLGVASWMASLAESRANPGASPGSSKGPKMSAIYGQTPGAPSSHPGRGSSSSKTSAACSARAAPLGSDETCTAWALRLRRDYSPRLKSARAMSASDSFSSGSEPGSAWPTPAARDFKGVDRMDIDRGNARPLNEVASKWASPRVTPMASEARQGFQKRPENLKGSQISLSTQSVGWSTQRASDGEKGGPNQNFGAGGVPLPAQAVSFARAWPTATVDGNYNRKGASETSGDGLYTVAMEASRAWSDPVADDTSMRTKRYAQGGTPLSMQAGKFNPWQTPSRASATGGQVCRSGDRQAELLLGGQAASLSSRLGQTTSTDGEKPSRDGRQLNPRFVEYLMNWPPGWTNFRCSETELNHFKRHLRSELLRIDLPLEVQEVQPDLFSACTSLRQNRRRL